MLWFITAGYWTFRFFTGSRAGLSRPCLRSLSQWREMHTTTWEAYFSIVKKTLLPHARVAKEMPGMRESKEWQENLEWHRNHNRPIINIYMVRHITEPRICIQNVDLRPGHKKNLRIKTVQHIVRKNQNPKKKNLVKIFFF